MADQTGKWIDIGGRLTYHPPFVNQITGFGSPPYHECVPTTGVNLINVAYLGQKPATATEVKALANAADRNRPSDGWHTSDFLTMVRRRYGVQLEQERLSKAQMRSRLKNGWAASVGINLTRYPQQPWDSGTKSISGHRILLLGYDNSNGNVKVMDPMFSQGKGFRGVWRSLDTVYYAMEPGKSDWRYQQVWIKEAERVITTLTIQAVLSPPRTVTLSGSNVQHPVYDLYHQDGQPWKNVHAASTITRTFDAIGTLAQQPNQCWKPEGEPYIRLRGTNVDGYWIDATSAGVTADLSLPACASDDCADDYDRGYAQGVADEELDWTDWIGDRPTKTARTTLYEMVDYGGGVDENGVGWETGDFQATAEVDDPDEPRAVPDEEVT